MIRVGLIVIVGLCIGAGLLAPRPAHAAIVRYAVIIGNNDGAADEPSLRYAQSDATRIYDVLRTLGDFREENMVLLRGRGRDAVESALVATNDRIRQIRSTDQAVLFVFYSGHADADALHLASERLPIDRLQRLVRGSSADLRLLVLDSCRSGALTRVKGGAQVQPVSIQVEPRLAGEGVVFLTSSSANEDAQESDEIGGSFFSHYLISGLVGPADADRDGNVTLAEAYGYAYDNTIRASSKTALGTHHPTFEFDMRGQGDVVLTQVRSLSRGRARLTFPEGRAFLVLADGPDGSVVAEVGVVDATRQINVAEGRYFIRGRARDHLLEGTIRVRDGETKAVTADGLKRVDYARLVRKGGSDKSLAHGPMAGYQLRTPITDGTGLCHGAMAGYPVATRHITVTPRLGFCRAGFTADRVDVTTDQYELDVGATYVFDVPLVSIGFGASVGVSLLRQAFATEGTAPPRNTVAGHADAIVSMSMDLPRGFYILADLAAQLYVMRTQTGPRTSAAQPLFALRPFAGVGKRF